MIYGVDVKGVKVFRYPEKINYKRGVCIEDYNMEKTKGKIQRKKKKRIRAMAPEPPHPSQPLHGEKGSK